MKKVMTIVLTALLLCTGIACAEGWRDGLGPSKPYVGSPELDLNEKMGYMMLYPSDKMPVQSACQRLYIYLPREDLKLSDGTFYLYAQGGRRPLVELAMDDADAITMRPMKNAELDSLLWGGGTCIEILLPRSLELGESYFVNLTEGAFVSEGGVKNPAIGGSDMWSFTLEGDYGVSGMEYTRPSDKDASVTRAQAGDQIRFDLVLGGAAVEASVYGHDDTVDFVKTHYDEDGEIVGEVMADNPEWGVMFLDMWGNVVGQVEFY